MNSLKDKLEIIEKDEIVRALRDCGWVQAKAAKVLGITERMIGYKIKKYGIGLREENSKQRISTEVLKNKDL